MQAAARLDTGERGGLLVLDLGASRSVALALAPGNGAPRVLAWAERTAALASHGTLTDLDTARSVLGGLLHETRQRAGLRTNRVLVGIGGGQVRCMRASGSFRSKLPLVLQPAHLDKALDAAADIGLPSDHEVLHVLPAGWQVDGVRIARSPLGMRARTVSADTTIVTVRSHALDVLQRALEGMGWELVGAAAEPLAAARVALSDEDRQRGAVLVDIGAETTAAVAVRDGVVQALVWVQAGGAHVTRDVSFALQLDFEQAEALKRRAACALVEAADGARQLEVVRGRERLTVNQQTLAGIVEARMEEILSMARDALRAERALGLGDRVVLAGGAARLRGAVDLAEQVFESPARLAGPCTLAGWREADGDPACATALGLVEYASRSGLLRQQAPAGWARALAGLRRVVRPRGVVRSAETREWGAASGAAGNVRGTRPVTGGVDLEERP